MYSEYLSRKIRRRKIITASAAVLIILIFIVIMLFSIRYSSAGVALKSYEDISCHYETEGDVLPQIDEQFSPSTNSIYFHKTSCHTRLDSRLACSIESAARTHPDWHIHVLFSNPINKLSLGDVNMELLKLMKNVYFWRVHIVDYAKGTPLEQFVSGGALNRTLWPSRHTHDVLNYLTLYKYGGVYIDLGLLVAKPLGGLGKNWAVRDGDLFVESSAMAFSRDTVGTLVADTAVKRLVDDFRDSWGSNGRTVITNVLKDVCSTDVVNDMSADKCSGFEVYPPAIVRTMTRPRVRLAQLQPEPALDDDAYFILYSYSHNIARRPFYASLAKRYCPIVYETYKDLFGI